MSKFKFDGVEFDGVEFDGVEFDYGDYYGTSFL
jgi:hypothetical protein